MLDEAVGQTDTPVLEQAGAHRRLVVEEAFQQLVGVFQVAVLQQQFHVPGDDVRAVRVLLVRVPAAERRSFALAGSDEAVAQLLGVCPTPGHIRGPHTWAGYKKKKF